MRERLDLVIFDCDGVLVDSEPIMNRAHAEILTACGYAVTPSALLERFCGRSDAEMLDTIEREWGRRLPYDYERRVGAAIDARCANELAAAPGLHEMLRDLALPVCVASSGTPSRIRMSLRCVGLLDRFEPHIYSATMVARGKPAPDLFLHAASAMKVDPARCVVVEDSLAGVTAAVAAAMAVIGYCGGSHCPPGHAGLLRRHGAAAAVSDMRNLMAAVKAL
jgi:HAD superfamily hydrolase (TIGR01509 family)